MPVSVIDLRADGSDRHLYRLVDSDGSTVIGVYGPDVEENRAFLSYSISLRGIGLPVPEIYAVDEERGIYLEEDLGDITLYDALTAARTGAEFPQEMVVTYERVLDLLPRVQVHGGEVIDYSVAYPYREFDRRSMMWDLNYFKYHFLKLAKIPFNESRLEQDFERLCDFLLRADRSHFLYRDFQSRNIMLREGAPWLIDYQGGRRGALQYDIASLLYDAKADLPESLREHLLGYYLGILERYAYVDRAEFVELYHGYVLVRIMQAMGAYGYRGFFERKPHFLASVPYAVANIEMLLARGLALEMPELRNVFTRIVESDIRSIADASPERSGAQPKNGRPLRLIEEGAVAGKTTIPLTVHLASFSYKKGYPVDDSGHGGGFVFDCRTLNNPGRYAEYRSLNGQDTPVVEFLEREPTVELFWNSVSALVDAAVESYMARGFTSLSVAFGCTGGQHRSVYFAERLNRHLRGKFPDLHVELEHREREQWPVSIAG